MAFSFHSEHPYTTITLTGEGLGALQPSTQTLKGEHLQWTHSITQWQFCDMMTSWREHPVDWRFLLLPSDILEGMLQDQFWLGQLLRLIDTPALWTALPDNQCSLMPDGSMMFCWEKGGETQMLFTSISQWLHGLISLAGRVTTDLMVLQPMTPYATLALYGSCADYRQVVPMEEYLVGPAILAAALEDAGGVRLIWSGIIGEEEYYFFQHQYDLWVTRPIELEWSI